MVRKLFALVSVSALAGLVSAAAGAGCSSEEPAVTSSAGNQGVDDGGADVGDAAKQGARYDASLGKGIQCYVDEPIDIGDVAYKPPRVRPGACTSGVFDVIKSRLKDVPDASLDEIERSITERESATCADCIFGPAGETWPPIVMNGEELVQYNTGGCVELKSHDPECAKATVKWLECVRIACSSCTNDDNRGDCYIGVQDSACKSVSDQVSDTCNQRLSDYLEECSDVYKYGVSYGGAIDEMCVRSADASGSP